MDFDKQDKAGDERRAIYDARQTTHDTREEEKGRKGELRRYALYAFKPLFQT
jgi:hypothetical protein